MNKKTRKTTKKKRRPVYCDHFSPVSRSLVPHFWYATSILFWRGTLVGLVQIYPVIENSIYFRHAEWEVLLIGTCSRSGRSDQLIIENNERRIKGEGKEKKILQANIRLNYIAEFNKSAMGKYPDVNRGR